MKLYVTTNYVPDGCDYLTAGKRYEVVKYTEHGGEVIDDCGYEIYIHLRKSAHINGRPWHLIARVQAGSRRV